MYGEAKLLVPRVEGRVSQVGVIGWLGGWLTTWGFDHLVGR